MKDCIQSMNLVTGCTIGCSYRYARNIEWIVISTETGHRKGKAASKPAWVWNLTHQAHALGIPVFMKEDLLPIVGAAQMVQEFPSAFYRVLEEQKTWWK
ncbi:MAG TPA: hypothetical protein IAD31_09420 [Candidatus Enterenecus faecium]|mgnify:FL=1|uniref:Uncharacterized protein n=1 Tax=Candidatus Enterenecus faecium TaxID=2840780 RepID=A0A9D0YTR3_9FIRM|nr:hypothetical protein [Candidatus Enterenecus faecium]